MAIYAIAITPVLLIIIDQAEQLLGKGTKSVAAYADDFTDAGSITNTLHWLNTLSTLGPLFGYYPEPTKSWLIMKPRNERYSFKNV